MKQHALEIPIEVETRTLQEVLEVKELIQEHNNLRIDRVMLDNMTTLESFHEGDHTPPPMDWVFAYSHLSGSSQASMHTAA